ncbi:MAG: hypothetical protein ACE5F1_19375, partial [Planctomycetota bacterium]
ALVDARWGLEDRLQTAAEFLGRSERSAFMEAALLDARGFARRASSEAIPLAAGPYRSWLRARCYGGAVLLLLLAALWMPAAERRPDFRGTADVMRGGLLVPGGEQAKAGPEEEPVEPRSEEESQEPERLPGRRTRAREGRKDSRLDAELKKTRGALGSGQSADAASASGASQARGVPSSQAQASLTAKKPARTRKKQEQKRKKPASEAPARREPEEDSGATAGRGAASGSNKSPSASPWASKDQVTSDDEEDLEEDEEVDDEFDNSDARGGVQPHLRDRRPPVNRDLGIGFGNMKNPDANGRGGPSELKKSRGVAALVLGVPIPDHVKGQPGPGKTKITQERVEPEAEDAAAVEATARRPREAPVGHLDRPELEAWMRELLRSYYRIIRRDSSNADKVETQDNSENPENPPKGNPRKKTGD